MLSQVSQLCNVCLPELYNIGFFKIVQQNQTIKRGPTNSEHTAEESKLRRGQFTSGNMKAVILALLVVLVVGHSEALTCKCGGKTQCSSQTQRCYGSDQVCANIRFNYPASGYFQSCYPAQGCSMLVNSGTVTGYCCNTDLCN